MEVSVIARLQGTLLYSLTVMPFAYQMACFSVI